MAATVRDGALLDALESLALAPFVGTLWRSVREGRDPTECWRAGGRWDDRTFDVLYTSLTLGGAIAERRFHLFRGQPLPPSKVRYEVFELRLHLTAVIFFDDLAALQAIGMNTGGYGLSSYADKETEYPRSQEIAEACYFLGADGIAVPNARHESQNLIVFCEQDSDTEIEVVGSHGPIDWQEDQTR
ncbi:MAG TPA: RES family NAD+ phosphorylase [Alphaproteobacteria bacterium]|jgi:RES domain-containing protein|nr:RES family NAD+ phosphorylase [Alphaproteobacteria bacterium]